ncbi:MAG: UPF0489 family protein [Candidatus Gracilibacteria bacterium]|nr:UPF0489 family protein [Candidatus Gracilibacteria bacterium]
MYKKPFHLTESVGNNAFSYEKRTNKTLYVPAAIDGIFSDIKRGMEVVFEDFDEKDILRSCTGLQNFVRMTYFPPGEGGIEGGSEIPMIVFDNHNHALYFWYEAREQGIIGRKNTLVHIDEHSDLWENGNSLTPSPSPSEERGVNNVPLLLQKEKGLGDEANIDLEQIFHFTNYECNVGNYIQPAIREGIIGKVLCIEDTVGMERYSSYTGEDHESIILNLDLDFFAPELDYIPFEDKKRIILHFARQAKLITVATSPFFIDQERAIEMLGRVFGFPQS